MFVPVVNSKNQPLMPTIPSRARRWIRSGRATPFWRKGIFCVRMNEEAGEERQEIVVGVDPGSKREGFTVKSCAHTYINIQTDAIYWVKARLDSKREARLNRRFRNLPYRKRRSNRRTNKRKRILPSIKARYDWKIQIIKNLQSIFCINKIIVEDIIANIKQKGGIFSVLQNSKKYFHDSLKKLGELYLIRGYETYNLRIKHGLNKISDKMSEKFEAHCVDSWVIANSLCEGPLDNKSIVRIVKIQFNRRQLHVFNPIKNGIRKTFGGTITLGLKRGSIIKHKKYGICYIGGAHKNRISLHSLEDGKRFCRSAKVDDCRFIAYNSIRSYVSKNK